MSALISLLPILLSIFLIACFVKLAALVLRRTVVSWRNTFLFALILLVLTMAKVVSSLAFSASLPPVAALALGVLVTLTVGSWFFSSRATNPAGTEIGWLGGFKLTGLSFVLMMLTVIPIVLLSRALLPAP